MKIYLVTVYYIYIAEEHADKNEWRIYCNEDSGECVETVRISPKPPETPKTAKCIAEHCKLAQTV